MARAWGQLNEQTIGTRRYWTIALQNASIYADTAPLIARYVRGLTLDLGAGKLAWRDLLVRRCTRYISGDITREHRQLTLLFDATRPHPFVEESFDTVFCHSVLEHTREPWLVFEQISRTLKPGGVAIISVPFVFYLHGQPHDYYRFTPYSLKYLAEENGFEVVELVVNGGVAELLLNMPSVALSSLLAALGLGRLVPHVTRFWFALARLVGSRLETGGLFATNHIAVLRKPASSGREAGSYAGD